MTSVASWFDLTKNMCSKDLPLGSTHQSFFSEIYAHCCDELRVELAICILVEKTGLSHSRVAEGKELDEVIVVPIRHSERLILTCKSNTKNTASINSQPWRNG